MPTFFKDKDTQTFFISKFFSKKLYLIKYFRNYK